MIETRMLETAPGMVFDVSVEGKEDDTLVLMLHGFGVSRYFWNAQVRAVGEGGHFAVAPNQRGYAAGARPDPADHSSYHVERLINDAFDIVAAVGVSISSATIGGPASHGRSRINTRSGWRR